MAVMPEVLLERAKFHHHQKNFNQAQTDLEEVQEIINRCGMNLYAVDAALLRGNMNLDLNQTAEPEYETAKTLIKSTGYHLRDPELDLLGARIAFHNKELDKAQNQLQQARERLEKMGYWGLLPAWERVENEIGLMFAND
jgi:tetratricopeptide (TPR) repeat protein